MNPCGLALTSFLYNLRVQSGSLVGPAALAPGAPPPECSRCHTPHPRQPDAITRLHVGLRGEGIVPQAFLRAAGEGRKRED